MIMSTFKQQRNTNKRKEIASCTPYNKNRLNNFSECFNFWKKIYNCKQQNKVKNEDIRVIITEWKYGGKNIPLLTHEFAPSLFEKELFSFSWRCKSLWTAWAVFPKPWFQFLQFPLHYNNKNLNILWWNYKRKVHDLCKALENTKERSRLFPQKKVFFTRC